MPKRFPDWKEIYVTRPVEGMPWFLPDLDPDLVSALDENQLTGGTFLDIGTGPGTQAMELAKLGFRVTATDLAAAAIEKAQERYSHSNLKFMQDDILHSEIQGHFEIAFDRGCFHVLDPDKRTTYVETVAKRQNSGAYFFLKTFSHLEPDHGVGPWRFRPEMFEAVFGSAYSVMKIHETVYQGTLDPFPKALFVTLRRK